MFWGRYFDQYQLLSSSVPSGLERFVSLARVGSFNQADELFSKSLHQYLRFATVLLERADALLNQGKFGSLSEFLISLPPGASLDRDQLCLLTLMRQLASVYVDGALLQPIKSAKDFRTSMLSQDRWDQCLSFQVS